MEIVKPEPLVIGGRAHYTLTSYEPVSVEVMVHDITDEDVEQAIRAAIVQMGGGPERLNDDAWIRDHFEGVHSARELRPAMREELEEMNEELVERQLATACAAALAERLMQSVAGEQVAQVRQDIEQTFVMTLQQQGMSLDTFIAQSGGSRAQMDAMFDAQARETAAQEAAVDAWAEEKGVLVSDEELPEVLGIPQDQSKLMMESLASAGQLEKLRRTAVRTKALGMIMDECECSYVHDGASSGNKSDHPHLKLV